MKEMTIVVLWRKSKCSRSAYREGEIADLCFQKVQICSEAFLADEHSAQMSSESHIGEDLGAIPSSSALSNDAEVCAEWSHIVERR